jgi:hypothetical protein
MRGVPHVVAALGNPEPFSGGIAIGPRGNNGHVKSALERTSTELTVIAARNHQIDAGDITTA